MISIDVVAVGAISSLGDGAAAYDVGGVGMRPTTAVRRDAELETAGLRRPVLARAEKAPRGTDPAALLLRRAAVEVVGELDRVWPAWRSARLALAIGTSSGGMASYLQWAERRTDGRPRSTAHARRATYFGPLDELYRALAVEPAWAVQVLAACASSTVAMGLGCRWLDAGDADLVLAGGYDSVSAFVAAGFEALGATTASVPAPFREGRDGMALGEGAALVALARSDGDRPAKGRILGFGASSDAVHVTAPDRTGTGLASAATAAIRDSGCDVATIGLVSAHGTATPFNDVAEARAIESVFGARRPVVHPFKAVVGHTLGAAGALESLAALAALRRRVMPAAVGRGAVDPEAPVRLLEENLASDNQHALKLSAAFGGCNAALVLSSERGEGRALGRRHATVAAVGEATFGLNLERVRRNSRIEESKLARIDPVSALAVDAVADCLPALVGIDEARVAVVVATIVATTEINERFDSRRRTRGARFVEPRLFPPTSPNLAAGQVAIVYGFRGPSLTVAAGPSAPAEALLVATDLVSAGDADAVIAVAADDVGETSRALWGDAGWPIPRHGAAAAVVVEGGPPVDRDQLARAVREVSQPTARWGSAEPGWPTLRRLAAEICRPNPSGENR